MKIAQVAPLHESVPPRLYGGTERIVSYLTEELVRQGHDVTLFASADSITSARLRPMCDRALRLSCGVLSDPLARHVLLLEQVMEEARNFDVFHFHLDYLPFSLIRRFRLPAITTLHGRLDYPDLAPLFKFFRDMHLISISDAQRSPLPWANWVSTVHHGLPESLYRMGDGDGGYLAFLGRISPEKGIERAVKICRHLGVPLRAAAKIDTADKTYFEENVRDLLRGTDVEFVGEIGEQDKNEFLGNARALLFPINWPEPFGLVMIEALACGTPVIAFRSGSVEEVIEDGVTGFIVSSVEEACDAVTKLDAIDRSVCRLRFEQRFSASRMCREYVRAYRRVLGHSRASLEHPRTLQKALAGDAISDVFASES
jgi:glycosyltransferase involved in cell wall biosynthesis